MKSGVKLVKKDRRDYSFHRTFGSVTNLLSFPDALNLDAGLTMPDQDADGLPFACTGYSGTEISGDEDKAIYLPKFTYDNTLLMEGITKDSFAWEKVGCDIRDALKSLIVYGLQKLGEGLELALNHRRGAYYTVELSTVDWFDSLRSTLQVGGRSIVVATPWYSKFALPVNGVLQAPASYDTTFASWHAWKICGWKTIDGVPYLLGKTWQGAQYGDGGWCYVPREIINQLLSINGTGAFTVAPFDPNNVQQVVLTLYETVESYLRQIVVLLIGK